MHENGYKGSGGFVDNQGLTENDERNSSKEGLSCGVPL
jgi:hypothetical protein